MKLGTQIKKFRMELSLSQEELAEKLYVSRQSISNWENDRTYPDIRSLLLLSEVFSVSLDELVKGDMEEMKQEISKQDVAEFEKQGRVFLIFCILILVLPIPLACFFDWWGMAVYLVVVVAGLLYGLKMEKFKKKYDIQTYKEIVAFSEGKTLTEIEKARESGKRPYQNILKPITGAVVGIVFSALMMGIMKLLGFNI